MINPRGHNHQISLFQFNPHPFVLFIADIEVASAIENVADLFVFVEMFVEEVFHFFFVVGEEGGGDFDFVAVFVLPRAGYAVYFGEVVGEFVVEDAEFGEVGGVDFAAAVVGFALVALVVVVLVGWIVIDAGDAGWWWTYGKVIVPVGSHCVRCLVSL